MSIFTNNFFGLDIGTTGLRLVQLFRRGEQYELLAAGSLPNTVNLQTCEDPYKLKQLATTILQLRKECGVTTKNVAVALPEINLYSQLMEVPKLPPKQLEETIRWETESFVPLPMEEIEVDWQIIPIAGEKDKVFVFVVAAPLIKINKLTDLVQQADLNVISVESSLLATSRALLGKTEDKEVVVVINLGFENAELVIVRNGLPLATRKIPFGGDTFTKALVSNLSLEWDLAEKAKLNIKNVAGEIGEKIKKQVEATIDTLAREIRRSINYFKEKHEDVIVTEVLMTGRSVALPDFATLIERKLNASKGKGEENVQVSIGNPWKRVSKSEQIAGKSQEAEFNFSVAVGLAMKKL